MAFSNEHLLAQRTAITLSGQNIKQQSDGTWKKYLPTKFDTSIYTTNLQEIKELPFSAGTSPVLISNCNLLMKAAQNFEIESFAALDFMELSIAQNEITLSKVKLANDKQAIAEIKSIIKQQIKDKNIAEKKYHSYFEKILEIRNVPSLNISDQEKSIKKISKSLGVPIGSNSSNTKENDFSSPNTEKQIALDCKVVRDDIKQKKRVIEIEPKLLFTFTPEKLKSYFKNQDLMQTKASFLKIGKDFFLKLHVKLFSKDAAKSYGFIAKESMMNVEFITGKKVVVFALDAAPAQFENYTGYTNYTILYPISREILDVMEDVPLNTISLMWSSGYEIYNIYEVETFITQLSCINSVK